MPLSTENDQVQSQSQKTMEEDTDDHRDKVCTVFDLYTLQFTGFGFSNFFKLYIW